MDCNSESPGARGVRLTKASSADRQLPVLVKRDMPAAACRAAKLIQLNAVHINQYPGPQQRSILLLSSTSRASTFLSCNLRGAKGGLPRHGRGVCKAAHKFERH